MSGARAKSLLKRTGRDLAYLAAVLPLSVLAFTVWVSGLTVTLSLLVLIVGIFVWLATTYVFRWTVGIDRSLAGWRRGAPIAGVYRRPEAPGVLARVRSVTVDRQTWKDLGWLVLNSIVGFAVAVGSLTVTAVVLGYIAMPLWWWAIPNADQQYGTLNLGIYTVDSLGLALLTTVLGLALAPLAALLNRGLVAAHSGVAARLLGPSEEQALRGRVQELSSTRLGAIEVAQEQLERIERDLHDGAQARIVALAMELGMAEEELDQNPEGARETVRRARDEALAALGELRDLSRGIRPALLEERGLAAAIDALAERSPLSVSVSLRDLEGIPEAVQTAAYFVVAEALTNVAKHSGAAHAHVAMKGGEQLLSVRVEDDGRGGADSSGSGLSGLRKRVQALDGGLTVASPAGGPTIVTAEIPCR